MSKARTGILSTDHSTIETPVFMPVGTLGTVKALTHKNLYDINAKIILGNTYHLFLRPGNEVISAGSGLHKFINWENSLLTDSGGFQVFSLASLRKVSNDGVEFSSHIDGSKYFFSPENVIDTQRILGSDIMMPLDECLENPVERNKVEKSLKLTENWEIRCCKHYQNTEPRYNHRQYLFSICQGSVYKDLRKNNIESLSGYDFSGNAIGGLAVGEPNEVMYEVTDFCTDILPGNKPRYLMGVGTPVDILNAVESGIDMFDCVLPSRNARHARLFTSKGEINLRNAKYKFDFNSPDEKYLTYTSANYSLSYLRHLFISGEISAMQLATIHNIQFYFIFMQNIRTAIKENKFKTFKEDFIKNYKQI